MRESYLDYAMSVIVGRALPDIRDGLKPVHRRILYSMYELSNTHDKPFKKSARITGEVLGKYHPHGDIAIYDALIRMAQDFSLRYPLVEGQGNMGCFTKDTKIALADGRTLSFEELIQEHEEGRKNYTFTIGPNKDIKIAEIKNPRLTKKNAELMKVILDNGEEIRCTHNHRFMLKDGSFREARELKAGDHLMSLHSHPADRWSVEHVVGGVEFLTEKEDVYDLTIDGTHNFALASGVFVHNSIDGDPPAAMRYTEVRMAKLTDELLSDIEKETVAFVPNFDNTLKEPVVLPSKIPNLLINGSAGIAVGMATNIPPHNLSEIVDAVIAVIDGAAEEEILRIVQGPDFPTGGIIVGKRGVYEAYKTGKGLIRVRAKAEIREKEHVIAITEIPYQVTKTSLIEQIVEAVKAKKIEGIAGIRDHSSDKTGIEVIIELKRDAIADIVLNQLYAHTGLETTFGIINLALVNNEPRTLSLYDMIKHFIEFRKEIVTKRCIFELKQAEERAHLLDGIRIALQHIDQIVTFLKTTKSLQDARTGLMAAYNLSEKQANAILDIKLQKLTSFERAKIEEEFVELNKKITWLKGVLADVNKILAIIKEELTEIKTKYSDPRRTTIVAAEEGERPIEELIPNEEVAIVITSKGYIKRISIQEYRSQHRGGKGIISTETKEEDIVSDVIVTRTHNYILFFTDKGRVYWLKAYEIPEASRYAAGRTIVNLLQLKDEKITAWIPIDQFNENEYLVMLTRNGIVKRSSLNNYSNPRKSGIIAITLKEGDGLIDVKKTKGKQDLLLATRNGLAIRFNEEDAREIGRTGQGVIGIRLEEGDCAVSISVCDRPTMLTITENGFGKRTPTEEYRPQHRGGKGVINIKTGDRNGSVVATHAVDDSDEVLVISTHGKTIRTLVNQISIVGRNTQGVRIIKLEEKEKVAAFATFRIEEGGAGGAFPPPQPSTETQPTTSPS